MVEGLDDFDSSLTKATEGAQEEKAPVKSKAPAVRSFNTGAPRATRGSDREYSQQMRLIRTYKMDDLENLPPVEIDEDGPERDYFSRVDSGEEVNMRLKLPGLTKNVVGVLSSLDGEMPLDDACKLTVNWVGKFTQ